MQFSPGTGGSVTAATLEAQVYALIRQIHTVQADTFLKNRNGADIIDSSIDEDTAIASGEINLYLQIDQSAGNTTISYPDPFIASGWVEGENGNGNATNYNHALGERVNLIIAAERTEQNKGLEKKFTDPSIELLDEPLVVPCVHNARMSVNFSIELESIASTEGSTYKAKEYLPDPTP